MRYAKYLTGRLQSIARNGRGGRDSNHDLCSQIRSARSPLNLGARWLQSPSERLLSLVEIVYICEALTGIELGQPFLGPLVDRTAIIPSSDRPTEHALKRTRYAVGSLHFGVVRQRQQQGTEPD